MRGGRGKDRFDGKKGTDTVLGGASKDRVTGGRGNDGSRGTLLHSSVETSGVGTLGLPPGRLDGQGGEDKEFGGPGDDTLFGTGDGEKRDLLDGGRGDADECLADTADKRRRCEPIPD